MFTPDEHTEYKSQSFFDPATALQSDIKTFSALWDTRLQLIKSGMMTSKYAFDTKQVVYNIDRTVSERTFGGASAQAEQSPDLQSLKSEWDHLVKKTLESIGETVDPKTGKSEGPFEGTMGAFPRAKYE